MYEIKQLPYDHQSLLQLKDYRFGTNWPIVYIIEDGKEAYIGETVNAFQRSHNHLENPDRRKLKKFHVIADEEYNKSATLDIESLLIQYMAGDGKYQLQNGNKGLRNSEYYDREKYKAKFSVIWKELQKLGLADKDWIQIQNSDLFKYSPYKALTDDQIDIVKEIIEGIKQGMPQSHLVSGEPGTGKTILAVYLVKRLLSDPQTKSMKIGLVVPMTSLRSTLKKVFASVGGLKSSMVIGPNDVIKSKYDILIVDEAHRLQRRVNLANFRGFDKITEKLGLEKGVGTQLDWIIKSSKYQVFFYDAQQSIRPADIKPVDFDRYGYVTHKLVSQMRVKGGNDYIQYIENILNVRQKQRVPFYEYDLKLFNDINEMVDAIKQKDKEYGLARVISGFAWTWRTNRSNEFDYDIEIDGLKLKWNSMTKDWVNSSNAINEVGCIHTIQGYDLNYAGVIVGPEVYLNEKNSKIAVDKEKYMDFNGKRGIENNEELEAYVRNIYKTLLTRGIMGTYLYVSNPELREYLKNYL